LHFDHKLIAKLVDAYLPVLSTAFIMISALCSRRTSAALRFFPIRVSGAMSYSIYLYHGTILFSLVYFLHDRTSMWVIIPLVFLITLPVSYVSYVFIERTSIRLGYFITHRKGKPITI